MNLAQPARPLPAGYELVRSLGAGGFGEVLLARQTSLNRLVAIKRIHAYALAGADALERFRREARVLAALDHRAIVRVYDFRRDGADATLIMEYVDGGTLSEQMERGPVDASAAISILRDVAEALHTAARAGVVHRDVKPDNVFVLQNCRAKLGDFGLARIVADQSVFRTADGLVTGTPAYFAPETELAENEPDERSDAYSFSVMAYELLTGRLPFTGLGMLEMVAAHIAMAPPPPDSIVKDFPPAAAQALLAGLEKDPAKRPKPVELVERLAAVPEADWPPPVTRDVGKAGSKATVLRPRTPVAPVVQKAGAPARRPRRRFVAAGIGALVVAAGLAALASAAYFSRPPEPLALGRITSTVAPAHGRGQCPSAQFEFTARLQTNGQPGDVRLQWLRPDRRLTDPVTLRAGESQRTLNAVLRFDVTGTRPLEGPAVLRVLAPERREVTTNPISYAC